MSFADVLRCFADRRDGFATVVRLTDEWADRYSVPRPVFGPDTPVRQEIWSAEQVGAHLDRLARIEPRMITDESPRRLYGPLVLVDFRHGRIGQIDGRRRANVWRHQPGQYGVLILCGF
ncbi:hypothetical protein [Panacagrimonas sp.]|uniref:hypothetical protein n=1 Tax=Panacagrimonas sp. TaxID=2480088 RepID=UPI003B52EC19